MLKKVLLLAVILVQFGLFSAPVAMAENPTPPCLPCKGGG